MRRRRARESAGVVFVTGRVRLRGWRSLTARLVPPHWRLAVFIRLPDRLQHHLLWRRLAKQMAKRHREANR